MSQSVIITQSAYTRKAVRLLQFSPPSLRFAVTAYCVAAAVAAAQMACCTPSLAQLRYPVPLAQAAKRAKTPTEGHPGMGRWAEVPHLERLHPATLTPLFGSGNMHYALRDPGPACRC
jgi:hypothetical protein